MIATLSPIRIQHGFLIKKQANMSIRPLTKFLGKCRKNKTDGYFKHQDANKTSPDYLASHYSVCRKITPHLQYNTYSSPVYISQLIIQAKKIEI